LVLVWSFIVISSASIVLRTSLSCHLASLSF